MPALSRRSMRSTTASRGARRDPTTPAACTTIRSSCGCAVVVRGRARVGSARMFACICAWMLAYICRASHLLLHRHDENPDSKRSPPNTNRPPACRAWTP